ncbi:MAG: 6-carboxytetrahydropterin synthase [Myxococcales bacterium]
MWEISHQTVVAAAHKLRHAPGDGERLHGHNWRIRATVEANRLAEAGWVVDFYRVGKLLREIVEPYEHVFLNDVAPFDTLNPTAENLAQVVAEALATQLDDSRVRVVRVDVWESDDCRATFYR